MRNKTALITLIPLPPAVNNLASLLRNMGDNGQALQLFKRTLDGRQQKLGPDHPNTLESVNNLARLLKAMGKYKDGCFFCEHEHGYVVVSVFVSSVLNLIGN